MIVFPVEEMGGRDGWREESDKVFRPERGREGEKRRGSDASSSSSSSRNFD